MNDCFADGATAEFCVAPASVVAPKSARSPARSNRPCQAVGAPIGTAAASGVDVVLDAVGGLEMVA